MYIILLRYFWNTRAAFVVLSFTQYVKVRVFTDNTIYSCISANIDIDIFTLFDSFIKNSKILRKI